MILDVVTDTKKEFKYPSGTNMELDVWIPEHNIAFEFQVFLFIYFVYLHLHFLCQQHKLIRFTG